MLWDVPRDRWPEYVRNAELTAFLNATLDPEDRALSRDKIAFAEHDRKLGIPWPKTLAVINRRQGIAVPGAAVIATKEDLWPVIARMASDRDIVLKPAYGERGRGFFLVTREGAVRDARGQRVSDNDLADAIFRYRHRLGDYGYLAQPALVSHPEIVRLTGIDALVTARIVTTVKNETPVIVESFVKIPGPGSLTDNFLQGVTGTVMAGFDCETGRMTELVGLLRSRNRYAISHEAVHPATGQSIKGEELPLWRDAVDLACRAAMTHPRTAALGWDVALAESGCVILDGNPNWASGRQLYSRSGIRPRLIELFPEHFH